MSVRADTPHSDGTVADTMPTASVSVAPGSVGAHRADDLSIITGRGGGRPELFVGTPADV